MHESTSIHTRISKWTLARLYDACVTKGDPSALEKLSRSSIVRWAALEAIQTHGNFLKKPSVQAMQFADLTTSSPGPVEPEIPKTEQAPHCGLTAALAAQAPFLHNIYQQLEKALPASSRSVPNRQGELIDLWPAIQEIIAYAVPTSPHELLEVLRAYRETSDIPEQLNIYDTLITITQQK